MKLTEEEEQAETGKKYQHNRNEMKGEIEKSEV